MAARLRKTHQEDVRLKIRTSCILKALDEHVTGTRELTSAQVASAKILLDKSMSNAPIITESEMKHSGQVKHDVKVTIIDPKL